MCIFWVSLINEGNIFYVQLIFIFWVSKINKGNESKSQLLFFSSIIFFVHHFFRRLLHREPFFEIMRLLSIGARIILQWRHNGRDCVSNHQSHHYLLNRLFRSRSNKTSKLRVTGLSEGNSSVTGEFSAQMASDPENVSIWWRHHVMHKCWWITNTSVKRKLAWLGACVVCFKYFLYICPISALHRKQVRGYLCGQQIYFSMLRASDGQTSGIHRHTSSYIPKWSCDNCDYFVPNRTLTDPGRYDCHHLKSIIFKLTSSIDILNVYFEIALRGIQ